MSPPSCFLSLPTKYDTNAYIPTVLDMGQLQRPPLQLKLANHHTRTCGSERTLFVGMHVEAFYPNHGG